MSFFSFHRSYLLGGAALVALAAPAVVQAQVQIYQFDVPAQDLGSALRTLAQQSRQQIMFDGAVVAGKRSPALVGRYSADDGLAKVLAGSGLSATRGAQGALMIRLAPVGNGETASARSDVEELVITASPILGSQRAAIQQQRQASNVVNVVAADTVGQFPDQSAAAALSRLPGVATQRDQGQERYLQVRGAPNRWTSVTLDGVPISGSDEDGVGRAFRFDVIPAVMLNTMEVNKSITPNLPGDAIVANVNLRTFSAFDREGFAGQFGAGYGQFELGGKSLEQYSGRLSWSGDRVGIVAAASRHVRNQTTDNREFAYDASDLPTTFDFRSYRVRRTNDAAMLGVEFKPAEGHQIFAKSLYARYADDEGRDQYVFDLRGAASGTRGIDSGDLVGVPVTGGFAYGRLQTSNLVHTLGGDHDFSGWKAAWRLSHVNSEVETYVPSPTNLINNPLSRPSIRYDNRSRNFPMLSLATTVAGPAAGQYRRGADISQFDPAAFDFALILPVRTSVESNAWVGKVDLTRDLAFGDQNIELRFGGQYEDRQIDGWVAAYSNAVVLNAALPAIGRTFRLADFATGQPWDTNFPSGFSFNQIDVTRLRGEADNLLAALATAGVYNPARDVGPADRYEIDEKILAGYASAKFDALGGEFVAGIRVEHQNQAIDGFVVANRVPTPLRVEQKRTDVFPSLNAKFEPANDLLLRFSLQSGISRPSFGTIRTGVTVDDVARTIAGGNPRLAPEKTYGGDASIERYLGSSGILSASAFYRRVQDVLFQSSAQVTDETYNAGALDRRGYRFQTTRNGGDGDLYGVELTYTQRLPNLPGLLDGFGVQANVAFIDGGFDLGTGQKADFPGTSNVVVNTSLFYENHGVSARLSYQWRDDWVDTFGFSGAGNEYRKAYANLDLSLRYNITRNVIGFLDVNNITDEVYVAYLKNDRLPLEVEQIGRSAMAGVRIVF